MAKRSKEVNCKQLTLEMVDALKLDGQSRRVSEAKRVELVAEEFVNGMIRYWGKYIEREVQEKARYFPKRVIWTQGKDMEVIYNEFCPDDDTTPYVASKRELRDFCIEECGANWYSHDVMGKIGRLPEMMEEDMPSVKYYADLISVHGDKMHGYFFGSLHNKIQISRILRSVDERDVRRLFESSYEEMWGGEDIYDPRVYGVNFEKQNMVVLKSAIRLWQEPIRIGHEAPRECDVSGLTAREKSLLTSCNNLYLGHEISHMFCDIGR
jgi:hypothetical protein